MLDFYSDIEKCYKKREEIILDLDAMFSDTKKENYTVKYPDDNRGGGKAKVKDYLFKDGEIRIFCTDWSKESRMDNLQVVINSEEYKNFITYEAYK